MGKLSLKIEINYYGCHILKLSEYQNYEPLKKENSFSIEYFHESMRFSTDTLLEGIKRMNTEELVENREESILEQILESSSDYQISQTRYQVKFFGTTSPRKLYRF